MFYYFLFGCVFEFRLLYFNLRFYSCYFFITKEVTKKVSRLKKFKRGTQKAIKFSAELAALKHWENFIAFQ